MQKTFIRDLATVAEQSVKVQGWVNTKRDQKNVQFIVLRDSTGMVQLVHDINGEKDEIAKTITSLTPESVISVTGHIVLNERIKLGGLEIVIDTLKVESLAEAPLPIDIFSGKTTPELRMDYRWLDLRRPEARLVMEIQTTTEAAMREFWVKENFIEIHSPKLMGTASESGAELFTLPYFGKKAYLAQSPQFYKQMAQAAGLDRVFEIGPVFRANPSFTSRHDTEFTSVDMEVSWVESHQDLMKLESEWIQFFFNRIKEKHGEAISKVFNQEVIVPELPFPQITLADAIQVVKERGHKFPDDCKDLDPTGEIVLAEYIKEKFGHEFVFVTDYPASVRAFYHMRHEDNPLLTKSFDLLFRGIEVTTGAQREHRYEKLIAQAIERGFEPEPLQFYFDFFRYGCPPHGGLGFGLTRMLMKMVGAPNVREVTYLYRGPNRLNP